MFPLVMWPCGGGKRRGLFLARTGSLAAWQGGCLGLGGSGWRWAAQEGGLAGRHAPSPLWAPFLCSAVLQQAWLNTRGRWGAWSSESNFETCVPGDAVWRLLRQGLVWAVVPLEQPPSLPWPGCPLPCCESSLTCVPARVSRSRLPGPRVSSGRKQLQVPLPPPQQRLGRELCWEQRLSPYSPASRRACHVLVFCRLLEGASLEWLTGRTQTRPVSGGSPAHRACVTPSLRGGGKVPWAAQVEGRGP